MALDRESTPVDDMDATYNYTKHRYELTQDYIDTYHNRLGIPIATLVGSSARADFLIQEISRQVNRWMQNRIPNNTRIQLEYLIAKDTDYREAIIQAMAAQYDYALISSGNLVAYQSGINTETGTVIDIQALIDTKVCQEVKETLETMNMLNPRIELYVDPDDVRSGY